MVFDFMRALFILLTTIIGFQLGSAYTSFGSAWGLIGAAAGFGIAVVVVLTEYVLGKVSLRGLSAAVFGLILALIVSRFINGAIDLIPQMDQMASSVLKLALVLILSYFGIVFSMRGRDEFNVVIPYVKFDRQDQKDTVHILDTSVIIDGRILDICRTKFVEGRFVVPRFVLKELQQVADSHDALKRNRGRRGLDILNKMRKSEHLSIRIHDEDFHDITAVDEKLVKLAKILSAKILTNDLNLNKVAELQGVTILNINDLSNALKPVVLPGEILDIRLTKEGKEQNQAVGYLDDGTMVVVENARRLLGNMERIVVSSVLQTSAGRMIFGRLESDKSGTK